MPKGPKLLWRLYFPYFITTFLGLVALSWYATTQLKEIINKRDLVDLRDQAIFLEKLVQEEFSNERFGRLDSLIGEIAEKTQTRLTVGTAVRQSCRGFYGGSLSSG